MYCICYRYHSNGAAATSMAETLAEIPKKHPTKVSGVAPDKKETLHLEEGLK